MKQNILKEQLSSFLKVFEPYQREYFSKKVKSGQKYSPLVSNIYSNLADFSEGGKKMRAFLVYVGYMVGNPKGKLSTVLPVCLSFEITQSFFLIHDDIIDHADLRRGKPTVHRIYSKAHGEEYGKSMALLLGDIACVELFELVGKSNLDSSLKVEVINRLIKVLLETAYGQAHDVLNSYKVPSIEEIYKVADLKSARYSFVAPLSIGAAIAGVSGVQMKAIEQFGVNAGLAFQIMDDILGVFGDEKVLGKSVLSDMREGKNTILIYKTMELADKADRVKLDRLWGDKSSGRKELDVVRGIVEKSGALSWCQQENLRLVEKAKVSIGKITNDPNLKKLFEDIADFVASRQK